MRLSAVLMVVLLTLLAVGTGAAAEPTSFDARQDAPIESPSHPTTITIDLQQNGDARWNVTTRFALRTENETAAFRRIADDFENDRLDTTFSTDVFERLAERASERTGRSMEITDVARTSNATNTTGRLTLTFTWTNFARTEHNGILLGDVFQLESGTWLPSITDGQRLVIRPPTGYGVDTSPNGIGVNDGVIDVNGSHSFDDGLQVEYVKSQGPESWDWSQLPVIAVLAMAMITGGLGVYVWTRRQNDPSGAIRADGSLESEPADVEPAETPVPETSEDDDVQEELLSDEERVERLIAANGGRMMQANIVKETNWSNAKVSQLLSAMDDDGRINKLRIGRENLITFPDEDVTDIE